jgi:hypothetical protein
MVPAVARAQGCRIETGGFGMTLQAIVVDNRDAQEMFGYLEARVETMRRRIKELERENEKLRQVLDPESSCLKQSA